MQSSTKAIRDTTVVSDEAADPYTKTTQAPVSLESLPSYPARDCDKCLPEEGLHTHECHRAIAAALKENIQATKNALLPDELNPGSNTDNHSRQGNAKSERSKTSGKDQIAALVSESLQPGQHPTSSLESFVKFSMAARVEEAAQLQQLDGKQAVADELYDTMISHYRDSPDGHQLFKEWCKAMEGVFVCIVEKWELKQEVEQMSMQAVEESKKRLAAPMEQVREYDVEG